MFQRKAEGQKESEDTLEKRLAIVKQTKVGCFVAKINGDGPVASWSFWLAVPMCHPSVIRFCQRWDR